MRACLLALGVGTLSQLYPRFARLRLRSLRSACGALSLSSLSWWSVREVACFLLAFVRSYPDLLSCVPASLSVRYSLSVLVSLSAGVALTLFGLSELPPAVL